MQAGSVASSPKPSKPAPQSKEPVKPSHVVAPDVIIEPIEKVLTTGALQKRDEFNQIVSGYQKTLQMINMDDIDGPQRHPTPLSKQPLTRNDINAKLSSKTTAAKPGYQAYLSSKLIDALSSVK